MNNAKKIVLITIMLVLVFSFAACNNYYEKTMELAEEQSREVAEEYLEALRSGDYDTCRELSLYEEDYSNISDYSRYTFRVHEAGLYPSNTSYNGGYYPVTVGTDRDQYATEVLLYVAYNRARGEWLVNTVVDESDTFTYSLEQHLPED
ncbi:MAG: hypothetical protein K5745_01910 [Saccharofermentans sp.]|nr:hypothetical protein [Saccharofermentans sp.]